MNKDIFKTHDLSGIKIENFRGGKIYSMDQFYLHPEKVIEYIDTYEPLLWKKEQQPTLNGIRFFDMRHRIPCPEITELQNKLSKIVGQKPLNPGLLTTNQCRFIKDEFNDFKNNFWWPHLDDGYTALIYLNQESYPGTNIYDPIADDDMDGVTEHSEPWRSRQKWKLVRNFESKFNRLIIFKAHELFHGMAVENELFFGENWRLNQVIFFNEKCPI